jgi:hypothetical protein
MSKAYIPKALREKVAKQAKYRCGYCLTQARVVGEEMELDHLFPESLGGPTTEENLWLACTKCNETKNSRFVATDPESSELVGLFNPREQVWEEHFTWNEEKTIIIGLTPVGRATVVALGLNRQIRIMARKLWVGWGIHPPTD